MILLILSVLSSLPSLSCFQTHSNNMSINFIFPLCTVWLWSVTLILWVFLFFFFSLCFVHFFLYGDDYFSCDMLQRKHIQVFRPQTSHSVPSVPLFFLFFFFLFPFFLFFFFFFFLFFCPTGEKKRSFFSSLAVLVLDQSQDGLENSGRHAEDSLEHLLFVFIFQKVFAFVLQFFFLLLS